MAQLFYDSTKPFPKNLDGTLAKRCDHAGVISNNGKYIIWTEQDSYGTPYNKMAKLIFPEEEIEPINYKTLKKECKTDPWLDMSRPRSKRKLLNKLLKVYSYLGLTYVDATRSVIISNEVDTACWGNTHGNKEFVLINPYIIKYGTVRQIAFVLQHEFMHRALYRGRKHLKDTFLVNVVLDICINALLARNDLNKIEKNATNSCRWLYPKESRENVLALCNSSLKTGEVNKLPSHLQKIWKEIYGDNPSNGKRILPYLKATPEDLYFRLKPHVDQSWHDCLLPICLGGQNPFGHDEETEEGNQSRIIEIPGIGEIILHDAESNDIPSAQDKRLDNDIRKSLLPAKYRRGGKYSNQKTSWWDNVKRDPEDIHNEDLSEYAKRIKTEKMLEDLVGRVTRDYVNDVNQEVIPKILTDEGVTLATIGFCPPNYPFYFNQEGETGKRRCVVFFDLSPSMTNFFAYIAGICKRLEDIMDMVFARNNVKEPGRLAFAGDVKELTEKEIEEMSEGKLKAGCSTSFDSVLKYCNEKIDTADVDCCLIFTDGESSFEETTGREFIDRGKNMYRIYIIEEYDNRDIVESCLDKLPGSSFTLKVPRTDKKITWIK